MATAPWKHPSVLRAIAVAGTSSALSLPNNRNLNREAPKKSSDGGYATSVIQEERGSNSNSNSIVNLELRKLWRPAVTEMEGVSSSRPGACHPTTALNVHSQDMVATSPEVVRKEPSVSAPPMPMPSTGAAVVKEYDFVVIGHGIAGRSAVSSLQELCPDASIAVVDPMLHAQKDGANIPVENYYYYNARCDGLSPSSRQVQLSPSSSLAATSSPSTTVTTINIRYNHAVLLATGSRGAPPPHYLLDEKAYGRILELRPTLLPPATTMLDSKNDDGTTTTTAPKKCRPCRPVLDPSQVRQRVLEAARRGETVALVGSGWDAVELAVACSSAAARAPKRKKSTATATTSIVFGGKGPLSHVLPQYLSAAVGKRLTCSKHKIQVFHRSLIRYVGPNQQNTNAADDDDNDQTNVPTISGLQLYTAKSYDLLDAARTDVHWLVVAPETRGSMGTAALPTASGPSCLEAAREGRVWYQTWSQLTATQSSSRGSVHGNNIIACYADDGRIAVNAELSAGNGVYAAGSVAKYPNPITGSAAVAGIGAEEGAEAGRVAASSMARDYYQHPTSQQSKLFGFGSSKGNRPANSKLDLSRDAASLKHPIPVWRSDQSGQSIGSEQDGLKEAGVYALCVGTCDSERFSTQAFWWTNQAKRLKQWLSEEDNGTTQSNSSGTTRRRRTGRLSSNPVSSLRPVYGRGVIYYLDQESGHIQGVMIWGLPFTNTYGNEELNSTVVQHMQEIIQTNGGFRNLGQDSEMERVRFVDYLTQSTRQLVVDAISPFSSQRIHPKDLPRPLIRYTEVQPAGVRRVRVLNRKQEAQGHGFLGEDLFAKSTCIDEEPPAPLPSFDNLRELDQSEIFFEPKFSKDVSREDRTAARRARAQALQDWVVWDWYQSRWDENEECARPPKEEHLWLRKGDEDRGVSSKDRFNDAMMKAIFPDGR